MISVRKNKRDYFPMRRVISHRVRLSLIVYSSTFHKKWLQIPCIIAPAGFWPRGQNPRRHPRVPRVYVYTYKRNIKKVLKKCIVLVIWKFSRFDETRRARWSRVMVSVTCNEVGFRHFREANTLQLQHGLRYDFSVVK